MTWTLRLMVWPDGHHSLDPEDYEVVEDGKPIGRIYRMSSVGRVLAVVGNSVEAGKSLLGIWSRDDIGGGSLVRLH